MTPDSKTPIATCGHDLAERDTSIADGLCPLCLKTELSDAIKERDEWKRKAEHAISDSCDNDKYVEEFCKSIGFTEHELHGDSYAAHSTCIWVEILEHKWKQLTSDLDAWRSLARRLAEGSQKAMDSEGFEQLLIALEDFEQMEKGTSPTSAQPPSI